MPSIDGRLHNADVFVCMYSLKWAVVCCPQEVPRTVDLLISVDIPETISRTGMMAQRLYQEWIP